MKFTAHNILFPDGTFTMSPDAEQHKDAQLSHAVYGTIKRIAKKKSSVLDLGCLEGGYSVELAKMGHTVLGVEARDTNYEKCAFVKSKFKLPNLKFIHNDVKNLDESKKYDIVLCCGLLYHLDNPVSFLKKMGGMSKMIVIDTHFSADNMSDCAFNLSPICENEGKQGRWFFEYDAGITKAQIEQNNWASYSNYKSFWLKKSSLIQAVKEAGFDFVYEQAVFNGDVPFEYNKYRALFVGIKK